MIKNILRLIVTRNKQNYYYLLKVCCVEVSGRCHKIVPQQAIYGNDEYAESQIIKKVF